MKNEIYSFCSLDAFSVRFFCPSCSDDSPFIAHEVPEVFLTVVLIECLVSIYVILLYICVYAICGVILPAEGNRFSLHTLREKYSPVFSKVFLNCKKTSFAQNAIISQSLILTLLRGKVYLEF